MESIPQLMPFHKAPNSANRLHKNRHNMVSDVERSQKSFEVVCVDEAVLRAYLVDVDRDVAERAVEAERELAFVIVGIGEAACGGGRRDVKVWIVLSVVLGTNNLGIRS